MDNNDRNTPATKGDVQDAIQKAVEVAKHEIVDELSEVIRDSETKLLNAFYGYAKTNDKRVLETEANEAVLRSRMATLETRVRDLEEKGNTPRP